MGSETNKGAASGEPTPEALARGMRRLVVDAICSRVMTVVTGGAFLVGMGLALGASNLVIGILAAIMPLGQAAQIPAILLVNRTQSRRGLVISTATLARVFLLAIAAIPFVADSLKVPLFLTFLGLFFLLSNVAGCSMNSWMRDLIPQDQFGSFFGKRLAIATAIGAFVMLAAGWGVTALQEATGDDAKAYSSVFVIGGIFGIIGALALKPVPEPPQERRPKMSFLKIMSEPLADPRFVRLLCFTATWNFCILMAGAFAAVYMLENVKISIGVVVALAVVNQLINAWFFRLWGIIADKTSNKAILRVVCPVFISTILMYPFTTMPGYWWGSIPILLVIHIVGGIATAGFMLCTANIALEFAPKGQATAYLATNATLAGLAGTIGPILGGWMADFFQAREFRVIFSYVEQGETPVEVSPMILGGLDFVFIFAGVIIGGLALIFLARIQEEGTIEEKEIINQAYASARESVFGIGGAGRRMAYFPLEMVNNVAVKPTRTMARVVVSGMHRTADAVTGTAKSVTDKVADSLHGHDEDER